MQRRLAAIVHADLAGFTRLMEGAETRTFRHLKAAQNEVWRPAIEAGGGRLVGTAGDAMLAEFGSAVAAVNAELSARAGRLIADLQRNTEAAQFGVASAAFFRAIDETRAVGGAGSGGSSRNRDPERRR